MITASLWCAYQKTVFVAKKPCLSGDCDIFTASNPDGERRSNSYNSYVSCSLFTYLSQQDVAILPCWGVSPDLSHGEFSYMINIGQLESSELCRRFNQLAFYRVCEGVIFLHHGTDARRVAKVGRISKRWFCNDKLFNDLILSH